jgi:FMN phosphatase YigB (HAD superfamily)
MVTLERTHQMIAGQTPQFIYFDLGNVLLTFDQRIACRQIAELTGITPERAWDIVFGGDLQLRYERGELSSREFHNEFCAASNTQPDYNALHRANSAMFELNVPVISIVGHLWAARYRLGILSNTCEAHWQYVADGRYTAIRDFFGVHILSYRERCSKPEAAIYQRAAGLADVDPGRIFFVDDKQENVDGAVRAGLDAVLFEGPLQLAEALRRRGMTFNY